MKGPSWWWWWGAASIRYDWIDEKVISDVTIDPPGLTVKLP